MKRLIYFIIGVFVITTVGGVLFTFYIGKVASGGGFIAGFTNGILSNVPLFTSGTFSPDGNYFAYTYDREVEMPDVDGSITIRGFAYPTRFQVIDCKTGKKILEEPIESGKYDQLYVVRVEDNLVWLLESVYHKGNRIALYDIRAKGFRFGWGILEKLNPTVSWDKNYTFFINPARQDGLLLEGSDKRYYRIDPNTGKAETVSGKFETIGFLSPKDFQVATGSDDYRTQQLHGSRQSITTRYGKAVSADDFIEVKFLTLGKNGVAGREVATTYYQDHFFVLSPVSGDHEKDMELAMLDKNTLKTAWKLLLPQKELKTIIPSYGNERFFIDDDRLWVTNNDYMMIIDLATGKMVNQFELFPQ